MNASNGDLPRVHFGDHFSNVPVLSTLFLYATLILMKFTRQEREARESPGIQYLARSQCVSHLLIEEYLWKTDSNVTDTKYVPWNSGKGPLIPPPGIWIIWYPRHLNLLNNKLFLSIDTARNHKIPWCFELHFDTISLCYHNWFIISIPACAQFLRWRLVDHMLICLHSILGISEWNKVLNLATKTCRVLWQANTKVVSQTEFGILRQVESNENLKNLYDDFETFYDFQSTSISKKGYKIIELSSIRSSKLI